MFSLKQMALASVAGLALTVGVVGCQPERPDVIPSSATTVDSGNGVMHYTASADGTAYVYDHTSQRLLWSGQVFQGQAVDIDTMKGTIMVGGKLVVNKLAAPGDQKDLYFDPALPLPTPTVAPANSSNNGVLVTPNVTVQPSNGTTTNNGVSVQPGVTVTPAPGTQNQ